MAASTDEDGLAVVTIPASLVSRPGTYTLFGAVDGAPPTVVVTFEVAASEGDTISFRTPRGKDGRLSHAVLEGESN